MISSQLYVILTTRSSRLNARKSIPGKAEVRKISDPIQVVDDRYCPRLTTGSLTHYFPRSPRLSASQSKSLTTSWVTGYDYDLTHTLYHIPPGNSERTVPTSELTIDGVELVGIAQLTEPEMVTFLEAVVKPVKLSPTVYVVSVGSRNLDHFVEPQMNRKNSHYMHKPAADPTRWTEERHDFETLRAFQRMGLRLTSPREDWVRECGVDWTEFFFAKEGNVAEGGEIEYRGSMEYLCTCRT